MRQKDDKEFAQLLNHLREGKHSEDDIDILKQRLLNVGPNASVDAHNNSLYTLSKADKAQIKASAVDITVGDMSDDLKKQMKTKSLMIQQRQWSMFCWTLSFILFVKLNARAVYI